MAKKNFTKKDEEVQEAPPVTAEAETPKVQPAPVSNEVRYSFTEFVDSLKGDSSGYMLASAMRAEFKSHKMSLDKWKAALAEFGRRPVKG